MNRLDKVVNRHALSVVTPIAVPTIRERVAMNVRATTLCHHPDCVTRTIGDETILVPVRSHVAELDAIYTLNEVGSAIWEQLDGQTRFEQIVTSLCELYDVTLEEAAQDTADFLQAIEAIGLITTAATHER